MTSISGTSSSTATTPPATSTSSSSPSASGTGLASISGTGLLSSLGLGTGLDVNSIISALVNAEQAGPQAQITAQTQEDQNQIAGLTGLSTALSGLQSALSELTSSTTYSTFGATFANTAVGSATTLPNASAGTYSIDVTSLATAQMRTSSPVASTAAVGSGTLSIGVGSKP
jgi:flagellar hook-associated protein 2